MLLGTDLCTALALSFCAIASFDVLCRFVNVGSGDQNTRWYLTHAVTNAVIVILVVPDCLALLRDPAACLEAPSNSDIPLAITVALHLFHCMSQIQTLTALDWAHHLAGNMLVCALAFPYHYGPLLSWGCLYVCGLPGGIDYLMLYLVKTNRMDKLTEKRWNRRLNMWIRCPGIVSFLPFAYTAMLESRTSVPFPILVAQGALNLINGVYFADRVSGNAAVAEYKAAEKQQRTKKKNIE
jgi:hypothetical protein|tara:strand:- start:27 stop:743 length:717 start_codon:yes stop_codon:yes gene_type:complete